MWLVVLACSVAPPPPVVPEAVSGDVALSRTQQALQADDLAAAERHVRDAITALESTSAPQLPDALLLLGEIQHRAGLPVNLPPVSVDADMLREAVSLRIAMGEADGILPTLGVLVERSPGEGLHGARAGLAWQVGDEAAARSSIAWLQQHGSPQGRVEAGLLLARVEERAGDLEAAATVYETTCSAAASPFDLYCERERGLFLAQLPDQTDAARQALNRAAKAEAAEIRGRALAALGILEAHEGSVSAARFALTDAVAALPPSHPDAQLAQRHLDGLGTDACGCEAPENPLEQVLLERLQAALPGVVSTVTLAADGSVELGLTREVSAEEQAALAKVQEEVLAEQR